MKKPLSTGTEPRLKWRVGTESKLLWRRWDDEYVVFNPSSGDTHVLNHVAAEALKRLERSPADAGDLAQHVGLTVKLDPDDLLEHMEGLVRQFDELGLVQPLAP